MATKSIFRTLSVIDVNKYTKKKGQLTYLSWSWAWAELMKHFPEAYRTVYENPQTGLPYSTDTTGVMVKVGVTIDEIERIIYLPVMDNRNNAKPVEQTTMRDINDTIQRCTTKAIALHGLALYIYAGEELPELPDGSMLPHHPSWEADRVRFCVAVNNIGLKYDDVSAYCESLDQPRPSQMDQQRRNKLLTHLRETEEVSAK